MTTKLVKAFRTADQRQLMAALAALARELLPDSPLEAPVEPDSEPPLLSEVRNELLEILRVSPNAELTHQQLLKSLDAPQLSKALDLINASLSAIVLTGNESEVRARLGEKGLLAPTQYRIEFTSMFQPYESLGVRRSHVERLLRQPDAVQHIRLREAKESESFSVFARTAVESSQTGVFTLLAIARRIGDVHKVSDAFRVYHEDVPIRAGSTPLDLLRAFVDKYGCFIRVGESPWGKFFCDEVFRVLSGSSFIAVDTSSLPAGTETKVSSNFRLTELDLIDVALAFGLNISRYREALVKRGVVLRPP